MTLPRDHLQNQQYLKSGLGDWRVQFPQVDADRPGRGTVSSGMVLLGVDTEEELSELGGRLERAGLEDDNGYRDPDGRIVVPQLFDRTTPFHD